MEQNNDAVVIVPEEDDAEQQANVVVTPGNGDGNGDGGGDSTNKNKNDKTTDDDKENDEDSVDVVVTPWQQYIGWFVADICFYIIVLNLASELVSNIHIDRFSISIFVAIVLKLVLDIIQYFEHALQHYWCIRRNRKIIGGFCMWLVVFSSKFLILWIDDVIFGKHVKLGYFWEILILSVVLMITEKLTRYLFQRLGQWERSRKAA